MSGETNGLRKPTTKEDAEKVPAARGIALDLPLGRPRRPVSKQASRSVLDWTRLDAPDTSEGRDAAARANLPCQSWLARHVRSC